jgi:two-component system cell cycle response regulator CtrA
MRILLIEDDPVVAQSVALMLSTEPFEVETAPLGETGLDLGWLERHDLILLDLNLPDISGFEVLRALRLRRIKTPVLILSGLGAVQDKVKGLGFGADDYLTKPFHKAELVARIHAVLRRSAANAEPVIRCGDFLIRQRLKRAEFAGRPLDLTTREFQLLEVLALRQGGPISKEMIFAQIYTGLDQPEMKIIDVYICKLRKKLAEASGGHEFIETVWGRGYASASPAARKLRCSDHTWMSRRGRGGAS